jgi:hypothetical protein
MTMLKRLGRLFTIKTRWEAWAVIWAITLGAVERGKAYMEVYSGVTGWLFFLACVAVVFLAGGKLLDSVRPAEQPKPVPVTVRRIRRHAPADHRSRSFGRPAGPTPRPSTHRH